jgi:heavy metal sensor kinase
LTLWYGLILLATLTGFGGLAYVRMYYHLLELTDTTLREELLELEEETAKASARSDSSGQLEIQFSGPDGYVFQVATATGRVLFQSTEIGSAQLPSPKTHVTESTGVSLENMSLGKLGPVRLASRFIPGPSGQLLIQAAASMVPNIRALHELWAIVLSIGPLVLACGLGCGYWLTRQALAPIDRMTATAAAITSTQLDRRLDEPVVEDELSYLARTFNEMITRLQCSFEEVRRFTANAAHELRTPLATMRTEAEVALRSPRSAEQDERVLEDLLEEIERLTRLVSHLLFLSREDSGIAVPDLNPMWLDDLVRDVGEHVQVMAREKGVSLVIDLPETYQISGDTDRLRQLFFNLLDNGIKYTPSGGKVTVEGECHGGKVHVAIADTGIGIPADHLAHVFDRFYRVDPSRSPETEGYGLGLAICQSIAEAHRGQIKIDSSPGCGTCVTLTLPLLRELVSAS